MRALFVFTPPESKRLIAKAVAQLPEIRSAKDNGEIVIGHGSTNVRVAEEILGECPEPDKFLSGQIINGILCVTPAEEKPPMIHIKRGKLIPPELTMEETLKDFDAQSVFIKGANAVDLEGNAGVYVANPSGGTIGFAYGILSARGCQIIVPVGLEKLIPSIKKACQQVGQDRLYYSMGIKIGMIPIINGRVITEIEAFRILFNLDAVHIGAGGVSGSQGSVVLVARGGKEELDKAITLIESIKGEMPLRTKKALCMECSVRTRSVLTNPDQTFPEKESDHCMFRGKREEQLPPYLYRRV